MGYHFTSTTMLPTISADVREPKSIRIISAPAEVAQLEALLAANGHRHPATPSYTGPCNTWSDGPSSHVRHHPATLSDRLILKQVAGDRCHRLAASSLPWPKATDPR